jgi:hypothetical protein
MRLESGTLRASPAAREESCLVVDIEYCGVRVRFGLVTGILFVFVFAVALGVSSAYWNKHEGPKMEREAVRTVVTKSDRTGPRTQRPSSSAVRKQVPASPARTQTPLVLKPQGTQPSNFPEEEGASVIVGQSSKPGSGQDNLASMQAVRQQGIVCHPNARRLAGELFPLRSSPEARADNVILSIGPDDTIDVIDSRIVNGAWVFMRHPKGVEGWVGRCFLHCEGAPIAEGCRWGDRPNLFDAMIGFFQELFTQNPDPKTLAPSLS